MSTKNKKSCYNELNLKKKIELIKFSESNSIRTTANNFNVGIGTVVRIKQRKDEYLKMYEENVNEERLRKRRKTEFFEINDLVWSWFLKVRAAKIPLSGPLIQEAALEFSKKLNKPNFKASNGWLESFCKSKNISFLSLNGESGSADAESAIDFQNKLEELCCGFTPENIFNCDETGLMFKALPNKSYVQKTKQSRGIKIKKDRLSVLLTASMTGEKLKPLVIGKSAKPRCFKNLDINKLAVKWTFNSKAWMTARIFEYFLEFNRKLIKQKRKILLLLDNCNHILSLN